MKRLARIVTAMTVLPGSEVVYDADDLLVVMVSQGDPNQHPERVVAIQQYALRGLEPHMRRAVYVSARNFVELGNVFFVFYNGPWYAHQLLAMKNWLGPTRPTEVHWVRPDSIAWELQLKVMTVMGRVGALGPGWSDPAEGVDWRPNETIPEDFYSS